MPLCLYISSEALQTLARLSAMMVVMVMVVVIITMVENPSQILKSGRQTPRPDLWVR